MNRIGIALHDSDRRIGAAPPPEQPGTVIDFERLLAGFRRQIWVYVWWILGMCVLAIAITVTTPPTYRALATLLLIRDTPTDVDGVGQLEIVTEDDMDTAEQVFRSRALALLVSDRLNLAQDPRFMDQPVAASDVAVETLMSTARTAVDTAVAWVLPEDPVGEQPPPGPAQAAEARRQDSARLLQSGLEVRRIGQSTTLSVGFDLHDPVLAAAIVNAYAEAYVADQLSSAFDRRTQTINWLQERLAEVEADARQAALDVQQFRIENQLVSIRGALVSEGNVDRFNIELTEARAEEARISAQVAAYEAALATDPETLADDDALRLSLPGDEQFTILRTALNDLRVRRDEVIRDFGPDHPHVGTLDRRIDDAAQRLRGEMERLAEEARGALELAQTQVMALQEALGPVVATNADASRAMVELGVLERRQEALARLHETFLVELEQAGQLASFPTATVRILTEAEVPRDPIAPSKRRAVVLAVLLGLFVGTLHAARREWRDRSLRTGGDVTEALGQPFLGYLPVLGFGGKQSPRAAERQRIARNRSGKAATAKLPQRRPNPTPETVGMPVVEVPLASIADPTSLYCETLRSVRNAAGRADPGHDGTVLAVTSLSSGEGKTYVATDLADILSLQSGPTLLIDCDFRKLSLSRSIGASHGKSIENVLEDGVSWRSLLVRLAGTNVDVLAWDPKAHLGKPSEILGSSAMHEMIVETATQYRKVVLDLAAIGPAVDAREVSPVIDQVLLLAQWGQTSRSALQRVLMTEPVLADRIIGVVLNQVNLRALRHYVEPTAKRNLEYYGT